jgi:hypothetical protein
VHPHGVPVSPFHRVQYLAFIRAVCRVSFPLCDDVSVTYKQSAESSLRANQHQGGRAGERAGEEPTNYKYVVMLPKIQWCDSRRARRKGDTLKRAWRPFSAACYSRRFFSSGLRFARLFGLLYLAKHGLELNCGPHCRYTAERL